MPFSRRRPDWLCCPYSMGQNDFLVPMDTYPGSNISVSGEYVCVSM